VFLKSSGNEFQADGPA